MNDEQDPPSRFPAWPIRLFLALLIANFLAMLVMNACALPAALFLPVYISGLAAGWLLVRAAGLEPAVNASLRFSPRHRRFIIAGYLVLALLYVLPRSGYLFEGLFGYATDAVCWDDYWHIQELNSLVNALRFPVVSSFQPGAYLSHYYCVWMLPVFLYKILPFGAMTIKVALFLAHLVYALLVLASAGYLAVLVSRTRNQFFWLHYLVLLCSGAGSLLVLLRPLVSHKWWMWDLLRIRVQIPDFADLSLWVIHHLVTAFSLLLAYVVYERMKAGMEARTGTIAHRVVIALLLAGACYGSVFVTVGSSLYVAYIFVRDRKSAAGALLTIGALSAMLILPLFWIYLRKRVGFGFLDTIPSFGAELFGGRSPVADMLLGAAVFVLALCAQLCCHVVILGRSLRSLRTEHSSHAVLASLSAAFLLSTAFISYQNGNDYAMRGSVIPVIVLGYVASCYAGTIRMTKALFVVLALLTLGSFNEALVFEKENLRIFLKPPENIPLRKEIYRYNTDRSVRVIHDADFSRELAAGNDFAFYVTERLVAGGHRRMWEPDSELFNAGPFGVWSYQRPPADPLLERDAK